MRYCLTAVDYQLTNVPGDGEDLGATVTTTALAPASNTIPICR